MGQGAYVRADCRGHLRVGLTGNPEHQRKPEPLQGERLRDRHARQVRQQEGPRRGDRRGGEGADRGADRGLRERGGSVLI